MLRIASASPPWDRPGLGVRAVRVLGLAEAMGLLPAAAPLEHLDTTVMRSAAAHLVRSGVGRDRAVALGDGSPERLAGVLDGLHADLLASPVPARELPTLVELLGADLVERLVGISASSLHRYAAGTRRVPDDVAARAHHLAVVAAELAGGYTPVGVRRWFSRPRAPLGHLSPAEVLIPGWEPEDAGAVAVLSLAAAMNSSPAT